jgi:hypothetical protein
LDRASTYDAVETHVDALPESDTLVARLARSLAQHLRTVTVEIPALPGAQIGDVADEPFAGGGAGRVEVTLKQVGRGDRLLAGDRGALVGAGCTAFRPSSRIRSATSPTLHSCPLAVELGRQPPTAEGLPGVVEHPLHLHRQDAPARSGRRLDPVAPGVERRPRHGE